MLHMIKKQTLHVAHDKKNKCYILTMISKPRNSWQ